MKNTLLFTLTFISIFIGCSTCTNNNQNTLISETNKVYDSVIDSLLFKYDEKIYTPVIIRDNTTYIHEPPFYPFTFVDLQFFLLDSLIDFKTETEIKMNFLVNNNIVNDISSYYKPDFDVLFLDSSSFYQLQGHDSFIYRNLYNKYPDSNGFLILSRVGFDSNYRYAIVYIGSHIQSLDGCGKFVFLVENNDKWLIKNIELLWVS